MDTVILIASFAPLFIRGRLGRSGARLVRRRGGLGALTRVAPR